MPIGTYDTYTIQDGGWHPYTTFYTGRDCCTAEAIVTSSQLEKAIRKIYDIIKEHAMLDISEEEFMRVIKDDG